MREDQSSLKVLSLFYLSLERTQFLDKVTTSTEQTLVETVVKWKVEKINMLYFGYLSDSNIMNDLKGRYQRFEKNLLPPHSVMLLKTGVFMVTII
jgi:hypothetical protein